MAKRTHKNIKLTQFIKDLFKVGTARQIAKGLKLSENSVYSFLYQKKVMPDYAINELKIDFEKLKLNFCEKELQQIELLQKEIESKSKIIQLAIESYKNEA